MKQGEGVTDPDKHAWGCWVNSKLRPLASLLSPVPICVGEQSLLEGLGWDSHEFTSAPLSTDISHPPSVSFMGAGTPLSIPPHGPGAWQTGSLDGENWGASAFEADAMGRSECWLQLVTKRIHLGRWYLRL